MIAMEQASLISINNNSSQLTDINILAVVITSIVTVMVTLDNKHKCSN